MRPLRTAKTSEAHGEHPCRSDLLPRARRLRASVSTVRLLALTQAAAGTQAVTHGYRGAVGRDRRLHMIRIRP